MQVINHASLATHHCGDCNWRRVAGPLPGDGPLQVVEWTIPAGASAELRQHGGALVAIVLAGAGKQRIGGAPQAFAAPCTLVVPSGVEHVVLNVGCVEIRLLAIEGGGAGRR